MNNRLIGLSFAAMVLLIASLATLVSPIIFFEESFSYIELCICAAAPTIFSLLISMYALTDICPTLFYQQYRTKRRLNKIRKAFARYTKGKKQPEDWDALERLLDESSDINLLYEFLGKIDSPLRSYNYDCMETENFRDMEVATISCLSKVLQLIQSSKDPYAHLQCYLDDQTNGKLDEGTAYKYHLLYSVEESLAHAIIFMLKAVNKCGLFPQLTRWPVYVENYKQGNLSDSVKSVLGWIAATRATEKSHQAELYVTAVYNLVAICKAEYIPISFYVAKAMERGQ